MWISRPVVDWLSSFKTDADSQAALSRDAMAALREELAAVRAERDSLKLQQAVDRTHFDWLRTKVNGLEFEKAALIEKAYGVRLPVPELSRPNHIDPRLLNFSFDDVGEEVAKELGLEAQQ